MNRAEAEAAVAADIASRKILALHDEVATLQTEARFYTGPEWQAYRDQVLEPRYRATADALVGSDETARMLRLQGEARALRYQIDRSESVTQELRDKKEQLDAAEQSLRDAAGVIGR